MALILAILTQPALHTSDVRTLSGIVGDAYSLKVLLNIIFSILRTLCDCGLLIVGLYLVSFYIRNV